MVGLKQSRSVQDEKFVSAIFSTTQVQDKIGASQENLIVDARPTTNAMAQTALGAGSENMENYKTARKVYLGIDNIHVMRDSLNRIIEALKDGDISPLPPNRELLYKSGWLRHISLILEGASQIANQVHYQFSHVLIHCSDGWDRTSQLSSLAQIFLDPYYRTLEGFMVLVEKEWLSFGHRFAERCGHLSSEKHFVQVGDNNQAQQVFTSVSNKLVKQSHIKYTSPVFHQFLDCAYQLLQQFPDRFEYNERFLRRLLYHTYSCQYGTFLYNSERERVEAKIFGRTRSVWDHFLARRKEFLNPGYVSLSKEQELDAEHTILLPNVKAVKWWPQLFGRTENEMNPVHHHKTEEGIRSETRTPVDWSPSRSPMSSSNANEWSGLQQTSGILNGANLKLEKTMGVIANLSKSYEPQTNNVALEERDGHAADGESQGFHEVQSLDPLGAGARVSAFPSKGFKDKTPLNNSISPLENEKSISPLENTSTRYEIPHEDNAEPRLVTKFTAMSVDTGVTLEPIPDIFSRLSQNN